MVIDRITETWHRILDIPEINVKNNFGKIQNVLRKYLIVDLLVARNIV